MYIAIDIGLAGVLYSWNTCIATYYQSTFSGGAFIAKRKTDIRGMPKLDDRNCIYYRDIWQPFHTQLIKFYNRFGLSWPSSWVAVEGALVGLLSFRPIDGSISLPMSRSSPRFCRTHRRRPFGFVSQCCLHNVERVRQ